MPLNIDIQQILLHMLNFTILFAALYFLLYKPVKNFMSKRDEYCKEIETKTETALADAEKIKADYENKLAQADNEIKSMKAEASEKISAQADEIKADAKAEAESIIAKAKADAQQSKNEIIESAGEEIKELAQKAAEKLVINNTSDAYDMFLDKTEKE